MGSATIASILKAGNYVLERYNEFHKIWETVEEDYASLGKFRLRGQQKVSWGNYSYARFNIDPFPTCCGIGLFHNVSLDYASDQELKQLGEAIQRLAVIIAQDAEFTILLSTDTNPEDVDEETGEGPSEGGDITTHLIPGWQDIFSFRNDKTENKVYIRQLSLQGAPQGLSWLEAPKVPSHKGRLTK